jgi:hypothetical protein
VVVVSPELDLVDVATQLQRDNLANFEAWVAQGRVSAVTDETALQWYTENPELWAVVVAPWVLVQAPASDLP